MTLKTDVNEEKINYDKLDRAMLFVVKALDNINTNSDDIFSRDTMIISKVYDSGTAELYFSTGTEFIFRNIILQLEKAANEVGLAQSWIGYTKGRNGKIVLGYMVS
jgi:hypothetical protein